jgi:ferredoxin-NADP reductase
LHGLSFFTRHLRLIELAARPLQTIRVLFWKKDEIVCNDCAVFPSKTKTTTTKLHDSMNHEVQILNKVKLNHDVFQFHLERPEGYEFTAGQAIELMLTGTDKKGPAPFTFTGLNSTHELELTIKIYEQHQGLTAALARLDAGDRVTITDPWDSFTNKGAGVFIAGGAGITPFIALLRQLHVDGKVGDSQLLFFNKTSSDIFMQAELKKILGANYIDIITSSENGLKPHEIDEALLKKYIRATRQPFYVCGPPGFVEMITQLLTKIGAVQELVNISL